MKRSTERRKERKEEGRVKRRDRECIHKLMNKRNTMGVRQRLAAKNSDLCWIRIPFC